MNFHIIVSFSLTLVCVIHVSILLHDNLNPQQPSVKHYTKKLKDIEFPLSFKFCLNHPNLTSYLDSIGYGDTFEFFYGRNRFLNVHGGSNYYGWQGHSNTSSKG